MSYFLAVSLFSTEYLLEDYARVKSLYHQRLSFLSHKVEIVTSSIKMTLVRIGDNINKGPNKEGAQ